MLLLELKICIEDTFSSHVQWLQKKLLYQTKAILPTPRLIVYAATYTS